MEKLVPEYLSSYTECKNKSQFKTSFADGNLFAAYQRYLEAGWILKNCDLGEPSTMEAAMAVRAAQAVLSGNLAAVCSKVSHGTTIQVCIHPRWSNSCQRLEEFVGEGNVYWWRQRRGEGLGCSGVQVGIMMAEMV
jgi:hypothetical protein